MANANPFTASKNPLAAAFKDAESKKAKLEADLAKLQEKLRPDPNNAQLRGEVQALKRDVARASDEYSELARASSLLLGGKNHSPPVNL